MIAGKGSQITDKIFFAHHVTFFCCLLLYLEHFLEGIISILIKQLIPIESKEFAEFSIKGIVYLVVICSFISLPISQGYKVIAVYSQHPILIEQVLHFQQSLFNWKPMQSLTNGNVIILASFFPLHEITHFHFDIFMIPKFNLLFTSFDHFLADVNTFAILKIL